MAQAAAAACCIVAGRALVRDRFEPVAGAPLLATVTAWTASLSVVGPILGGYLEASAGYRGSFALMTLFAAGLLAVHLRRGTESLRHPAPIAPGALARGVGQTLRNGCFWAFTLAACASFAGLFAFMAASPRLFIAGYGMAPAHYGYVYGIAVLGLLVGNVACRRLLPRSRDRGHRARRRAAGARECRGLRAGRPRAPRRRWRRCCCRSAST